MSATSKGGRKPRAVSPEVALAMLQSAMSYCQLAELPVTVIQEGTALIVRIEGVTAQTGANGTTSFSLANQTTTLVNDGAMAKVPA